MDNRFEAGRHPQFSVVIPTYNRAGTVCRAVDSVLHQTYPAAEVVVVDDGSRDATRERIGAYGGAIRYLYQENAGAAAARNRGAAETRFPWLAFLDSDDLWSPEYLERMAAAVVATAGRAALYFSDAEFEEVPPPRNRWARVGFNASAPHELLENPADLVLAEGQPMLLPFSVIQRSVYLDEGGLWERLSAGEDTHLFVRLGLKHPVCAVAILGGLVKGAPEGLGRLTGVYSSRSTKHWDCSVLLWNDILHRAVPLTSRHRRILVRRIADAYWRKGILSAKEFKLFSAVGSLGRSLFHDPSIAMEAATRKLGGHS